MRSADAARIATADSRLWLPPPKHVLTEQERRTVRERFPEITVEDYDSQDLRVAQSKWLEPILARRIGLERFLIVDIENEKGRSEKMQLEYIAVVSGGSEWKFWGWMLRKDGTVGLNTAGQVARFATFRRLHLDGVWRPLEVV